MKPLIDSLVGVLVLCVASSSPAAQTCSGRSSAHTAALLELYTSEGCSSCPPADHAVSALRQAADAGLVVPLSMHVDYWDYIGWKDRFADPRFAVRQRRLADLAGNRLVYTPEMFMAGRELREWQENLLAAIGDVNRRAPRADIEIRAGAPVAGKLPVEVRVQVRTAQAVDLYVALYENGLNSKVNAGENSGTTLHHDYVVRDWIGPIALAANAQGTVAATPILAVPPAATAAHLGVAAFVQNASGEVLQALALPLCSN